MVSYLFKYGYFNSKTGLHKAVSQTKFVQAMRLLKKADFMGNITLEKYID